MSRIENLIREYKTYSDLEAELKEAKEEIKKEIISALEGSDEFTCSSGKITYRPVISNRFDTTSFKQIHQDLYNSYLKPTVNMKFTCH